MSTLSATSTDAEVTAAYKDNASYAEDGSIAKAGGFQTAVIFLLRGPEEIRVGNELLRFSHVTLRAELESVRQFLSASGSAGAVKHPDISTYRD